jgi:hypothetical protein
MTKRTKGTFVRSFVWLQDTMYGRNTTRIFPRQFCHGFPVAISLCDLMTLEKTLELPGSPADFGNFIAAETEKWGKVVKFAGLKPE